MDEEPLVSIITCTYNRAHLLPRAINSILNQTYTNYELLIVDDGSTDNTRENMKAFQDERIKYHRHECNRGVLAAKNTGFNLAKGKYLCTLDDDDVFLPGTLEIAVKTLERLSTQGIKILWSDCIDAESEQFSNTRRQEGIVAYEEFLCNKVIGDYFNMFERSLLGSLRWDERLWGWESIPLLKLARISPIYYIPQTLMRTYRLHGERVSDPLSRLNKIPRIILTLQVFLNEFGSEIQPLCPKYYAQLLASLGYYQLLIGEKREGRKVLSESLKNSFSFKIFLRYFSSFVLNKSQTIYLYKTNYSFYTFRQKIGSLIRKKHG